jgi:hypothetical protein
MYLGLQPLIVLIATIGIACAIAWLLCWFIDWVGVIPAQPAKVLKIIVVVIVAAYCVLRLLSFFGIG